MRAHLLRVLDAEPSGRAAIRLELEVPPTLAAAYRYVAGQHIKVSCVLDGRIRSRSFSLCTGPTQSVHTGRLVLGVREVPDGQISSLLCRRTPEWLAVSVPRGTMTWTLDRRPGRVLLWGVGSGVTAIMGIADEVLRTTASTVDVVLVDRSSRDAMLGRDLRALVSGHPGRLRLHTVWTRKPRRAPFDAARVSDCLATLAADRPGATFVCGPTQPVELVRKALLGAGYDTVQFERFDSSRVMPPS
jgi:ring-1,2-phenylacetyl-CoA epoxidase subunit PaaE